MDVWVVVPTYNEAANIIDILRRIRAAVPYATILVVDDASPDGTADMAEKIGVELGSLEVLRRAEKSGLGSAYRDGFRLALDRGADALVEIDADGSHDPAVLPALLANIANGADLAIGSRYVPGGVIPEWTAARRWLSRWGNRYAAGMLGLGVNDNTSGFRAYAASLVRQIDLDAVRAEGYGFQIEMTYRSVRLGARIVEFPITFVDRTRGTSKMSSRIVVEALGLVTLWGVQDVVSLRRRQI
jgi:glycosyltransferase involved in cell wall biosynthesis